MISELFIMQALKFTKFEDAELMDFDRLQRKIKRVVLGDNNGVNKRNDFFGFHWLSGFLGSFGFLDGSGMCISKSYLCM